MICYLSQDLSFLIWPLPFHINHHLWRRLRFSPIWFGWHLRGWKCPLGWFIYAQLRSHHWGRKTLYRSESSTIHPQEYIQIQSSAPSEVAESVRSILTAESYLGMLGQGIPQVVYIGQPMVTSGLQGWCLRQESHWVCLKCFQSVSNQSN